MENANLSPDDQADFDSMRTGLSRINNLLYRVVTVFFSDGDCGKDFRTITSQRPITGEIIFPMIQAQTSTTSTILSLSTGPGTHSRDCLSLSRSVYELALNVCYVLAGGEGVADLAKKHAIQKSYRDLDRTMDSGKSKVSIKLSNFSIDDVPEDVKDIIEEFTNGRNTERRDWANKNINNKLSYIEEIFGNKISTLLQLVHLSIYRHSSEILHGTYFGVVYFLGLTSPNRFNDRDEFMKNLTKNHLLILYAISVCHLAVARALEHVFKAPQLAQIEKEIYKISREIGKPDLG